MAKVTHLDLLVEIEKYIKEKGLDRYETTVDKLVKELSNEEDVPF